MNENGGKIFKNQYRKLYPKQIVYIEEYKLKSIVIKNNNKIQTIKYRYIIIIKISYFFNKNKFFL